MSSLTEDLEQVRVRVTTGDPLAEVFLVDHAFALVERSVGELDRYVKPGVYKVKVRLGDVTAERLVVLEVDQDVDMSSELVIASPAPLIGTSQASGTHAEAARAASRQVVLTVGHGAQILLMARSWSVPGPSDPQGSRARARSEPAHPDAPPGRPSLRRPDGSLIADLGDVSPAVESLQGPAYAATIGVDPGSYLLRWYDEAAGAEVEQAVYAVAGWQTQVFLLKEADERQPDERRPDQSESDQSLGPSYGVSMLMARYGFDPSSATAHAVEVARSALAKERKVASEVISESLFLKFDSPMLGLYGAHLMLIAEEAEEPPIGFSQHLFDEAVANLAGLLGADQPDVVALSTRTSGRDLGALAPVSTPPLLWRSWLLLLDASHDRPALVPADTWRRASRPLPSRPFLTWEVHGDNDEVEAAMAAEVGRVVNVPVPELESHESGSRELESLDLGPEAGFGTPPSIDDRRRQLSRQMLLPAAAIDELAAE